MAGSSATSRSSKAVVAALVGNGFVTAIKIVAFLLSGSSAMLSESIHSFADTGNQFLLYLGLRRAGKRRDEDFPYGYGGERLRITRQSRGAHRVNEILKAIRMFDDEQRTVADGNLTQRQPTGDDLRSSTREERVVVVQVRGIADRCRPQE